MSRALSELDPRATAVFLAEWLPLSQRPEGLLADGRLRNWLWVVIETIWRAQPADPLSALRTESMRWIVLSTLQRQFPGLTLKESSRLSAMAASLGRHRKDRGGVTRSLYLALVETYYTTPSVPERTGSSGAWFYIFTAAAEEEFKVRAHPQAYRLATKAWEWRGELPSSAMSAKAIVHTASLIAHIAAYMTDNAAVERNVGALDRLAEASDLISHLESADISLAVEHLQIGLARDNLLGRMSHRGQLPYLDALHKRRDALLKGFERYRSLIPEMPSLSADVPMPHALPGAGEMAKLMEHLAETSGGLGDWELSRQALNRLQLLEKDELKKWEQAITVARRHPDLIERQRQMERVLRISHHFPGGSAYVRSRMFRRSADSARRLSRALTWERLHTSAEFWNSMYTEWSNEVAKWDRKAPASNIERPPSEWAGDIQDEYFDSYVSSPPLLPALDDSDPDATGKSDPLRVLRGNVARGVPANLIHELRRLGRLLSSPDACVDLTGISEAVEAVDRWSVPRIPSIGKPVPSGPGDAAGAQLWMLLSAAELAAVFTPHLLPEIYNDLADSPHTDLRTKLAYTRIRAEHARDQRRPNMVSSALFDAARYALLLQDSNLITEQLDALIGALEYTALWTTGGSDLIETVYLAGQRSEELTAMLINAGFVKEAARLFDTSAGRLQFAVALRPEYAMELQLMEFPDLIRKAEKKELFARIRARILAPQPAAEAEAISAPRPRLVRPKQDEALIRLIPGNTQSWALITRVAGDGERHHAVALNKGSAEIVELAEQIWFELRPSRINEPVPALELLHKVVVQPILPIIADARVLLFVPQGLMSSLPLQAARGPEGYIIERHAVAYFPDEAHIESEETERLHVKEDAPWLVCGWDVSAQAERESLKIKRILLQRGVDAEWPANAKVGRERLLGGTRLQGLHIAGHGRSLAWPQSFDSILALSSRNEVTASRWITHGPKSDFVFLNVCGLGRSYPRGGDLNGFPLAIRLRGATAIIAATGYIPPDQAHTFARLFYGHTRGADSLTMYREAMLASIECGMPPHGWAPYAHFGRGRRFPALRELSRRSSNSEAHISS